MFGSLFADKNQSGEMECKSFSDLPVDLLHEISGKLTDVKSRFAFSQSCKYARKACQMDGLSTVNGS